MKISYKILCELLPGLNCVSARDVAQKLTFSGLEVEAIDDRAAKELEISDSHEGLLTLADDTKLGTDIATVLGFDDVIFDVNVTPNRGDALSHWGVARDLSALYNIPVSFATSELAFAQSKQKSLEKLNTIIEHIDTSACRRLSVSEILSVGVAPSPNWLKNRLQSLGQRPINNIVDATNYVMLLTGHPVHAYDARGLRGNTLRVDTLKSKQKFYTLDDVARELQSGDLVIGDADGVVGLAGIMGGANSQIKPDTTHIVLEVAHFNPAVIRKTAKRLGLQTDSSYRFERFVNPATVLQAHQILSKLICHLAGGLASTISDSYPQPFEAHTIQLKYSQIKRHLGIEVSAPEVSDFLSRLGCEVASIDDGCIVNVPLARSDLKRPIDLVEEVARLKGLDAIPAVMPRMNLRLSTESKSSNLQRTIKDYFVENGFFETVNYSFGDENIFAKFVREPAPKNWLKLKNPLSEELAVMRPSLLPHLVEGFVKNHRHSDKGLKLFELRNIYFNDAAGPTQKQMLAGVLGGNPYGRNRFAIARDLGFDDVKGLIAKLWQIARIQPQERRFSDWPFHPGQAIEFIINGKRLATAGLLHPQITQSSKIKGDLCYFEIDYALLCAFYCSEMLSFVSISPLPPVYRDLAVVADEQLSYQQILQVLNDIKPQQLKQVELFDVYRGSNLPQGKKSIAFSMTYESSLDSMTDVEVNKIHFKLVEDLKNKLGLELR